MIKELVDAFHSTDSVDRKLKILSLSPYSLNKTMSVFQTHQYLVRKSRDLKNKFGILPEIPQTSKGKVLTSSEKEIVKSFFQFR